LEVDAQLADRAEQRVLHAAQGHLQAFGDLVESPAFDVFEQEDLPFLAGQPLHRGRQVLAEGFLDIFTFGRLRGHGFGEFRIEFFLAAPLAPPRQIDGRVQRDAVDPGIERGLAAEFVTPVPGLEQRILHRVRGQVCIPGDAQAGVVPANTAFAEHRLEGVGEIP